MNVCTRLLESVAGGHAESGFWASSGAFVGPGSLLLLLFLEFPCSCPVAVLAVKMPAAARAAEPAPINPLRVSTSFSAFCSVLSSVLSLMRVTFLNRMGFRQNIRSQTWIRRFDGEKTGLDATQIAAKPGARLYRICLIRPFPAKITCCKVICPTCRRGRELSPASKCNGPRQCEKIILELSQFHFCQRREL